MSVSRREFLAWSSAAAASAVVLGRTGTPIVRAWGQASPQTPPMAPPTAFGTIRRNVGFFTGRGGTIGWLSNKSSLIVVDTQFPDTAKLCLDGLRDQAGRAPDLVFLTHHHGDHTGGNGVFKGVAKKIVAHARVPELQKMAASQPAPSGQMPPAPVLPDALFETAWGAEAGDEQVEARHHGPAHTGGDAVIHFKQAHVVHMGDLLFHQRHPFVDRPGGASIQNWIATLEKIVKEMPEDTIYIAGHARQGLPITVAKKDVLQQRDYFEAVLSHVRKGIAAGKPKQEITALEALPKFEDYQSSPPNLTLASVLGVAFDELQ